MYYETRLYELGLWISTVVTSGIYVRFNYDPEIEICVRCRYLCCTWEACALSGELP